MWIRLESYHQGCIPTGVYQDFSYEHLIDFCGPVMCLPTPKRFIEDGEGCSPTFWFTKEGWEWYGSYFEGLFEPEARKEDNATILISIIKDPENFHPLYEDEYQVAICYEEAIEVTSSPRWRINSLEDWKEFERELIHLMMYNGVCETT